MEEEYFRGGGHEFDLTKGRAFVGCQLMDEAKRTVESMKHGDRSDASVLDDMTAIGLLLETLRISVTDADPSGGVGRMMHCSWFGELILAFPQAHAIRVPLATSDDKTSLAGYYIPQFLYIALVDAVPRLLHTTLPPIHNTR